MDADEVRQYWLERASGVNRANPARCRRSRPGAPSFPKCAVVRATCEADDLSGLVKALKVNGFRLDDKDYPL